MKKILTAILALGFTCAFATTPQDTQAAQAAEKKCEASGKTAQQCQQAAASAKQKAAAAKSTN